MAAQVRECWYLRCYNGKWSVVHGEVQAAPIGAQQCMVRRQQPAHGAPDVWAPVPAVLCADCGPRERQYPVQPLVQSQPEIFRFYDIPGWGPGNLGLGNSVRLDERAWEELAQHMRQWTRW